MEFDFEDVYYLFIRNRDEKSVMKLQRDYYWDVQTEDGIVLDLGTLFSQMDIEDIVDSLSKEYDEVELIDEEDIDDFMND